jgi:predicted phosphoadenosine phosphosulfate sulfurtransferase
MFRVSNLVHEKAFRYGLKEIEPETYNQLEKRLKGVHAAIYGKENLMYSIKSLPEAFNTWKE